MYSMILLEQYPDKPYAEFLCWLIDKNFYKGLNEKITIKRISVEFGIDTGKVTHFTSGLSGWQSVPTRCENVRS